MAANVLNYTEQGGARRVVASGGSLDVESGGELDIESGGSLKIAGTAVTSSAAELNIMDGVTATAAEINQHCDESANVEVVTTTNVITAAESGKTFFLNSATGFVSTLPAPAAGLRYSFIVGATPPTSGDHTVTTNGSSNVVFGAGFTSTIDDTVDGAIGATNDTISFVASTAVSGDRMDVISDGTNWYAFGGASVAAAITFTTAS